jgi:Protein of unknown function (DUF3363)
LIGKVVGVGLIDEITDRTWVVVDAIDGRAHYAELGRLNPADVPGRGMIVALGGDRLQDKPESFPRFQLLSSMGLDQLESYEGPTWLDEGIVKRLTIDRAMPGFAAELRQSLLARAQWLRERGLAEASPSGEALAAPEAIATLRQRETRRVSQALAAELNASYIPHAPGRRIDGVYERAVTTPTGRLAVIRREDTFTLAPWKPALEQMRGRAVIGFVGQNRLTWTLDRGRGLPEHT